MAYFRDRRAFGNVGTRRFRGARYGDGKSPRFQGILDLYGGASAAYSLRALSTGWLAGDVVEVRRSSDNTTQDFTASEITSGAMVDWVNETVELPLDFASGAAAAYSLRNLSTSYSGNVVDVRRSSDNAEDSFNAAEVADGTLVTWVGAGNDGFVSTWYDQSGNDNHATQGTDASQPKIVSGGALVTGGIDFDGVDDFLDSNPTLAQPVSIFSAYKAITDNSPITGTSSPSSLVISRRGTGEYIMFSGTALAGGVHSSTEVLASCVFDGATSTGHWNGVEILSGDAGSLGNLDYIGRNISAYLDGTLAEIIIYNSDQSDNRAGIESNIASKYGITLPSGSNSGSIDGFVSTWYDQSGNGNDATQATTTSQPKIVDAGALVTGGLDFDGVDDWLETASAPMSVDELVSVYSVATFTTTTGRHRLVSDFLNTGSGFTGFDVQIGVGNSALDFVGYGDGTVTLQRQDGVSDITTGNEELYSVQLASGTSDLYINSDLKTTRDSTSMISGDTLKIGGINTTVAMDGNIQEIIVYNTNESANRAAIETNINDAYSIY